jgi:stress response protein SCP2
MIELKKKGDSFQINLSKNNSKLDECKAQVKMKWKKAIDLDLHAYAINSEDQLVHVYFAKKKSSCGNILLDHDAGVGNTAGNNEENLYVKDLSKIKKIIFVANIYRFFGNLFNSGDRFNKYDGTIHIKSHGEEIIVFLNSEELGRWAVIAMIDNQSGSAVIKNINTILKQEPNLDFLNQLN